MQGEAVQEQRAGFATRVHLPELDVLRGLAVVFMIANHLGVSTPTSETSGTVWFLTFLGSMAPVLFFFVTGLGYGVGSTSKSPERGDQHLTKFAVLIVADMFLWLQPDVLMGNDFLGFIAINGLLLEGIRRLPRSVRVSLALMVLVLVVRFAVAPYVRSHGGLSEESWVAFLLGLNGHRGFSYPPCPWLAYSLIGYGLGRWVGLNSSMVPARRGVLGLLSLAAALGFVLPGVWLVRRGSVLFRWGTMSFSFFLISLGVVAASLMVALFLCSGTRLSRLGRLLSLSGVRSFSIVPLHYVYRDLSLWAGMPGAGTWGYLVWLSLGVVLCFETSKIVPRLTAILRTKQYERVGRRVIILFTILAAGLIVSGAAAAAGHWLDLGLRSSSQLALCVLFGLLSGRTPGRTHQIKT